MIERHGKSKLSSLAVASGSLVQFAVTPNAPYDGSLSTKEQARQLFGKTDERLRIMGSDKSHLLFVTIILADLDDYAAFNQEWSLWIDPDNPPARACIGAKLTDPAMKVEIIVSATRILRG
jgi:enamine deaminase RidA (YjgF/YER057c/UK114 family)